MVPIMLGWSLHCFFSVFCKLPTTTNTSNSSSSQVSVLGTGSLRIRDCGGWGAWRREAKSRVETSGVSILREEEKLTVEDPKGTSTAEV